MFVRSQTGTHWLLRKNVGGGQNNVLQSAPVDDVWLVDGKGQAFSTVFKDTLGRFVDIQFEAFHCKPTQQLKVDARTAQPSTPEGIINVEEGPMSQILAWSAFSEVCSLEAARLPLPGHPSSILWTYLENAANLLRDANKRIIIGQQIQNTNTIQDLPRIVREANHYSFTQIVWTLSRPVECI